MPLDLIGNISLVIQIVILFLLVLGVPIFKGYGVAKNLRLHGYITVVALILHTILIFAVMVPSFLAGLTDIGSLPLLSVINVWLHAILGTFAEVLGFVIVGYWVSKPLSKMGCMKAQKLMMPLFLIWVISVIGGTIIHLLEML